MAEKQSTNTQANALAATTDATTGMVYPTANEDPYLAAYNRQMEQINAVATRGNDFRVYEIQDNADAIGVRPGRTNFGSTILDYAGEEIDGLTDNATTLVWLQNDSGTASIATGSAWPTVPHRKLAEVTMLAGIITAILDRRGERISDTLLPTFDNANRPAAAYAGRVIFNTDDSQINIDTGSAWILPDGTTT